ncbi:hypothetical protein HK100_000750, partial [Physocladia obscura]
NNNPGPGTYDINYAIGRHVGNDNRFALLKSKNLKHVSYLNAILTWRLTAIFFPK